MDNEPRDVRLPFMVTQSEAAAIDAWRYANQVPSRAEAIRRLIEAGLQAAAAPAPKAAAPTLDHHRAATKKAAQS